MTVAVVGDGPAVEAVRAALADVRKTTSSSSAAHQNAARSEDVAADVEPTDVEGITDADFAVVVGVAGSGGFHTANERARDAGVPLVTVEVGGLGGHPLSGVDAAVAALAPDGPCFDCLGLRVAATDPERASRPRADRSAVRLAGAHAGRLAAAALAGDDVTGTVLEFAGDGAQTPIHRALAPVPNCDCDGKRDRSVRRGDDGRSLSAALDAAEPLVDDRVGVVSAVGERESFPAPYYLAAVSDTSGFSDASAAAQAAGVALDWDAAYMKAVGEAFERYSAGVYREREFETHPADHPEAVPHEAFVRPDDTDPADPADQADELDWIRGESLHTGDDALLPADRVVFPPPEDATGPSITTGLGLGNSGVDALLSGLYETVERDATMLAWYSTFDPLGLRVESESFRELERHAHAEDLDVTALLCTQDVDVPVVAVAVHRDDWPRFALGSAADLDPAAAATGALCEALQNWMELRALGPEDAADENGAIGRYADFPREVRGLVDSDATIPAADVGTDDPPEGAAELDAVLAALDAADLHAYAARLTPRDIDRAGFEAVRVLVPQAQPLFVQHPFFGDRAKQIPREMGFQPRLDRPFHPFP